MKSKQWFNNIYALRFRTKRLCQPRLPLRLELLEDRWVPAVFNVNSTADILAPSSGTVTLRSAIQAANNTPGGSTINLAVAGTYQITIPGANTGSNNTGAFAILPSGSNLTINNTSGGTVVVDGGDLDRVFDINPAGGIGTPSFTVTMQGFTIQDGFASPGDGPSGSGGGIRDQGNASLVLTNMVVTNNYATADGGGISMENGASTPWKLTLNSSTITNNHAGDAGGGVETDGSGNVTINTGTVIAANSSVNQGGGIWLDALAPGTVTTPTITNGGSGFTSVPTVVFTGGAPTVPATAVATITNGVVTGVTITNAGSGYSSAPTISFSGGGGVGATATTSLNTVFESANLTVIGTQIQGNSATAANNFGGGIGNAGNGIVSITASTLYDNSVNGTGGGFGDENNVGTLNILNSSILNNTATGTGGGLQEGGPTTTINDATIVGNSAEDNDGGVAVASTFFTLNNTIVAENFEGPMNLAGTGVAQINVTNPGTAYTSAPVVTITNAPGDTTGSGATATANFAVTNVPAAGNGIVSSVTITNPGNGYTLPPLVSFSGGGGSGATATAVLSIPAPDINGAVTSGSGNFIGINAGTLTGLATANGNQVGTPATPLNPNLGAVQNNGGPTLTRLPLAGSLVINTGVVGVIPAGTTTDQRGSPRINNGLVDVGAVQSQLTTTGADFAELGAYRPSDGSWSLDSNGTLGFQGERRRPATASSRASPRRDRLSSRYPATGRATAAPRLAPSTTVPGTSTSMTTASSIPARPSSSVRPATSRCRAITSATASAWPFSALPRMASPDYSSSPI